MRKEMRGTFTVEAALILPLFLGVFVVCLQLLFYSHDKVLIGGIAHETVVLGSGREWMSEEEMEAYFQRQVAGRTLIFQNVDAKVEIENKIVEISCEARKNGMQVKIRRRFCRTEPEKQIRNLRKLEKLQEELGDLK